ncbi:MAG: hypothetical protein R3Y43_05245 [Alphaproteobacteria bacterium]
MKRVIILDVDGVLLNHLKSMKIAYPEFVGRKISDEKWEEVVWQYQRDPKSLQAFGQFWGQEKFFSKVPPMFGMQKCVKSLLMLGYDLYVVTSVPEHLKSIRAKNLQDVFGDVFKEVVCVGSFSKKEAINNIVSQYQTSFFVDDSVKHLEEAYGLVDKCIWMSNQYQEPYWNTAALVDAISVENADALTEFFIYK